MSQQALINFNIKIPEELRKKIKLIALKENQSIQELVTFYLEKMVLENEKKDN